EGLRVAVSARAAGDRALDVLLRHRVRARLLDRVREREVARRVGPSLPRGDDDRARELREELAPLRVGGALLVLDRRPLAMPGHAPPPARGRGSARAPACRPSAPGETTRRGSVPAARGPDGRRARRGPRPPDPPRARAGRG